MNYGHPTELRRMQAVLDFLRHGFLTIENEAGQEMARYPLADPPGRVISERRADGKQQAQLELFVPKPHTVTVKAKGQPATCQLLCADGYVGVSDLSCCIATRLHDGDFDVPPAENCLACVFPANVDDGGSLRLVALSAILHA